MLIGLDFLETYRAIVDHYRGLMLVVLYGEVKVWRLDRLPSGHWGFKMTKTPTQVTLADNDALLVLARQQSQNPE